MASTVGTRADVVIVGSGIMSATFAALIKELQPDFEIALFEALDGPAQESTSAFNNAGTGHAALCELNYTPQSADGTVGIARALGVNTEFDLSRQLWAHLVRTGAIAKPESFIHDVPHISLVRGEKDVAFLKARYAAMTAHHCFRGMEYADDAKTLAEWMPLVMEGRDPAEPIAATRMITGTDVDFGALTRGMLAHLQAQPGFSAHYSHKVTGLDRAGDAWNVTAKNTKSGERMQVTAPFVLLGAGGGALALLQKSGIAEGKGFAGFPVSGLFLRCDTPDVVARHGTKVYGKASVGAPPMSVPHLDARFVDGKQSLLFGPYAGFSTKFLKSGSYADLPLSVRGDNLGPLLAVGRDNFELTKYLIGQVMESKESRFAQLRDFFPNAKTEDWRLVVAGQRVQVIMPDAARGGKLQFGTEVVAAADGSLAAVLGASPGASTSVAIMLKIIARSFAGRLPAWEAKLVEMIPSYGRSIAEDPTLCDAVRSETAAALHLANIA